MEPEIDTSKIWLFIILDKDDRRVAPSFAARELSRYKAKVSTYVPAKAEMLNNVTSRTTHPNVTLLFLFKKGNELASLAEKLIRNTYSTLATYLYYMDISKNTEAKWREYTT